MGVDGERQRLWWAREGIRAEALGVHLFEGERWSLRLRNIVGLVRAELTGDVFVVSVGVPEVQEPLLYIPEVFGALLYVHDRI